MGGGLGGSDLPAGVGGAGAAGAAAAAATALRRYTVCAVVSTLFTIQYSVKPLGTLRLNQPTMKGRNLRMAFALAWLGSWLWLGCMIFWLTNWLATSSMGSTR